MHDIAEFLKEYGPFRELEPEALEALAGRVEIEFFSAGTTIFKQGEQPQHEVHVVRRGAVELVDHGRVLDLLGEGELFGHPSMVSGLPTGFEARAHEDSLCYALAAEEVLPLLTRPAGLQYLARSLLDRPKPGPVVAADVSGFDLAQQPVLALIREEPLVCEPGTSLKEVAGRMTDAGTSSALIALDGDQFGIVTDEDLRSRVVAMGLAVDAPVSQVMSSPVIPVAPEQNGADVLLTMLDHGIRHVPVLASDARPLGVISDTDLLAAETRTPFVLRRAIADAGNTDELRRAARRLNPTLIGLHEADLPPAQISAVISVVADALIRRTLELVSAAGKPAPSRVAWLSLGSHGRREAVPSSDIDSGIVWTGDEGPDEAEEMRELADEVLATLAATGWESDEHGVTASGSIAAHSVEGWQRMLDRWLDDPGEYQVAMALSIVFDSRSVYGPPDAFGALAPLRGARNRQALLRFLLKLALADKPPTGFLRDIVVEHTGEHRGSFDIKRGGLVPIIDIARYAGVASGTKATSTVARLRAADAAGKLRSEDARTLEEAFDLFAALRLEHQVHQLEAGVRPDDHLDPSDLNSLTRQYLRDAFRAVASVQKSLSSGLTWGT